MFTSRKLKVFTYYNSQKDIRNRQLFVVVHAQKYMYLCNRFRDTKPQMRISVDSELRMRVFNA